MKSWDLIGSNGSGKTTLGKLAAGLIKPADGTVWLNGIALKGKALQRQAWFVMQEAEFQLFTNSVWNELLYGSRDSPELRQKVEQQLRRFDLWECRNRHPFSLSGGQMQKLVRFWRICRRRLWWCWMSRRPDWMKKACKAVWN